MSTDYRFQAVAAPATGALATNKVLRNTYILLSMTLLFSAAMAAVSTVLQLPYPGFLPMLAVFIGGPILINRLRNSSWGILAVFAFTGLLGLFLGPVLNLYLTTFRNGSELIMMALGGTGLTFLGLSGYVLTSRKDFSFMGGFLFAGLMVMLLSVVGLWVASMFGIQVPAIQLALSALIVMLMAGYILFDTSRIVHGGETNYVMATVSLYVNIYVLFTNLLQLLGVFGGDD